jgi:hypothetical protein
MIFNKYPERLADTFLNCLTCFQNENGVTLLNKSNNISTKRFLLNISLWGHESPSLCAFLGYKPV